jgi:hypothetical protein
LRQFNDRTPDRPREQQRDQRDPRAPYGGSPHVLPLSRAPPRGR